MRAVILAAGQGTRLRPLTDDRPKGMVEVSGKSIIEWQVELFRSCGIEEIAIVKGYKPDSVLDLGTTHFTNEDFESTNMVHSLFCAGPFLIGDVIVSYGDILYTRQALIELVDAGGPISVVVDLEWKRYYDERWGDALVDAESLIINDEGLITSIGKPEPALDEIQAQYVGLMKFDADGIECIRSIYALAREESRHIGWNRPPHLAHMTDLLQEAAEQGCRVGAVPIERGWVEIDTLTDLEIAKRTVPGWMG